MGFYTALIMTSLCAYVTGLTCPTELKNCSCAGGNTISCSQRGYYVFPEDLTLDLRNFYLERNNLSEINDNHMKNFKAMTYLTLRENRIRTISERAFSNNVQLLTMDLSYNQLSSLPLKLFKGLDYLTNLYLGNNRIKRIETDHFNHIMSLEDVRINNNELEAVGKDAFVNSAGITKLYLEFNQLEIPEKNWLIHFHHTGEYEVYLDNNPWSCDCRMREFRSWAINSAWFLNHARDGISVPQCYYPTNLRGTSLAQIQSDSVLLCVNVTIMSQIRDYKIVEGGNIELSCDASGFPRPDMTLTNSAGKVVATAPGGHLSHVFEKVTRDEAGTYFCKASGYDEKARGASQTITIELTVYRSPASVVSAVLISLIIIGAALGGLVWLYKKKYGSKASYGRLPNNSAYCDSSSVAASAKYNADSMRAAYGGPPAPTSVTNPYRNETDSQDEDEDDVIAEYAKDTEFLV